MKDLHKKLMEGIIGKTKYEFRIEKPAPLLIKMWATEKSPSNLTVAADNGTWKIIKVLKYDKKTGRPIKWIGKWKWNTKKPVNGKQ